MVFRIKSQNYEAFRNVIPETMSYI